MDRITWRAVKCCRTCRWFWPESYGTGCVNPKLMKFDKVHGYIPPASSEAINRCELRLWEPHPKSRIRRILERVLG